MMSRKKKKEFKPKLDACKYGTNYQFEVQASTLKEKDCKIK